MAVEFDEDACVLVISADAVLRRSLARMLGLRGFRAVEAADEGEAAEGSRRGPAPCLILADLSRSPLDDRAGARRIRERAELRHIPLLVVSAEEARAAGTESFIAEVFDFEQLLFLLGRLTPPARARDGAGRP